MNQKALHVLEFNKIKETLLKLARSKGGQALVSALEPYDNLETVNIKQQDTADATSLILKYGSLQLGAMREITMAIKRLEIGGSLSMLELLNISDVLNTIARLVSYSKQCDEALSPMRIATLFSELEPLTTLQRAINRCIISEEEMADDASSTLHSIRREISNTHGKIRSQLNKMINSTTTKVMLQDPIITMRNDRFCVPVKAEYRSRFPGMIHDQSSTGATLFVEPMAVVQMNNQLTSLANDEKKEIERILEELSAMAANHTESLSHNVKLVSEIDFIFAKGELALNMKATRPHYSNSRYINLKKARHPLLEAATVVPIDIYLGDKFTTLVITGPNTGGKTVTLKTLGLLSIMGQAGLHIPANDNSSLTLLDEIFADIGDEQSIEQSLSTFSSHMVNIVDILGKATERSLCLFDELGAGTDPTEGAALAMAILENLFARNILTMATTHYSELKVYALSTEGVENASCEFDVATLRPTYKLLIGIPGKSNAFAISKRLGLTDDIISEAKNLLQQKEVRFEDLITDLEMNKKQALAEKEKAQRFRREAEALKAEVDAQKDKLAQQKERYLSEAKQEAYRQVQAAKDEADAIIRQMNKLATEGGFDAAALEEGRSQLRKSLTNMEQSSMPKARVTKHSAKDVEIGDKVHVGSFNQNGIVVTKPNNKKEVQVQMGIMKMNVPLADLTLIDESGNNGYSQPSKKSSGTIPTSKAYSISTEIDVRGMNGMDAVMAIDKYLDDAYLSKLPQATIIHGKGTGVLRIEIHKHLKQLKYIKSYRLGSFGEGESGVTIVEFK